MEFAVNDKESRLIIVDEMAKLDSIGQLVS